METDLQYEQTYDGLIMCKFMVAQSLADVKMNSQITSWASFYIKNW